MLSPQRAVAAASGGAGEAPDFPRARSVATSTALAAVAPRRPYARAAALPRPGVGTARAPPWCPLAGLFGSRGCSRGRDGRARAAPSSATFGGRGLLSGETVSAPWGCCRPHGASPSQPRTAPRVCGPGASFRGFAPPAPPWLSWALLAAVPFLPGRFARSRAEWLWPC